MSKSKSKIADTSFNNFFSHNQERTPNKKPKISNYYKHAKKRSLPGDIYETPPKYGKEGEDVVYDRYIASRATSAVCSPFSKPLAFSKNFSTSDSLSVSSENPLDLGAPTPKSNKPPKPNLKNVKSETENSDQIQSRKIFCSDREKQRKLRKTRIRLEMPAERQLSFHTPKKKPRLPRVAANFETVPLANPRLRRALFPSAGRRIAQRPLRTLDAPGLRDNFYQSLLDWSARGCVAVALGRTVYLYNEHSHEVAALFSQGAGAPEVTALAWDGRGARLAVGLASGRVELWDAAASKLERALEGHRARVGRAAWRAGQLATGSKDRAVAVRDPRAKGGGTWLQQHKQEVCGLRWAPFSERALASGGNDNELLVWDVGEKAVSHTFSEHRAAVKAIDWSPHKPGLLASGGGSSDNTVRFWDTRQSSTSSIQRVDSKSQVCNLAWSKNSNEFVTTHGYSKNWIKVYSYGDKIKRLAKFNGHQGRILHLSMSPDGTSIVTGSGGDETIKFWKIFPPAKEPIYSNVASTRLKFPLLR